MLNDVSLPRIISYFGFFVGCAFITYVIRTMGYFSIVAPEYLGFFIETDLIMGAIMAMPFVFGALTIGYTIFWVVSIMVDNSERIDKITNSLAPVKRFLPVNMKIYVLYVFWFCVFVSSITLKGDNYIIKATLSLLSLVLTLGWIFQGKIEHGAINPLLAVSCVIVGYTSLHDIGKVEAIEALNHSKARYSVTATDKRYVNVILLRASSSSVLIKVGADVILYDRGSVSKIERSIDQIEQR